MISDTQEKAVLVHSGGLDSTVLLWHLAAAGRPLLALTIDYGQRHHREIDAARAVVAHARERHGEELILGHQVLDIAALGRLLRAGSLTDPDTPVPEGHYTEETMKATIVPNRNMILLSLAGGWALACGARTVAYAAHSGDHAIYPDCRESFAQAMHHALSLADWEPLALERPFVDWSKADIVRRGRELGAPLELTWSCYKGGQAHCGRCGTCIERREAFYLAGVADPTEYAPDAPATEALLARDWRLE
jgi:7-cyano-7-deazaguanine synthase